MVGLYGKLYSEYTSHLDCFGVVSSWFGLLVLMFTFFLYRFLKCSWVIWAVLVMFPSKVAQGRLNSRFGINHKHNMRPKSVGKNINYSFTWQHDRLTMDLDRACSTSVNRSARERHGHHSQHNSEYCCCYSPTFVTSTLLLTYVLTFRLTTLLVCSLTDSLTHLFPCFLSCLFLITSYLHARPTYLPT